MSVVGLGGNNFGMRIGQAETTRVVRAAIDAGITLIDTAPAYGGPEGSELLLATRLAVRRLAAGASSAGSSALRIC